MKVSVKRGDMRTDAVSLYYGTKCGLYSTRDDIGILAQDFTE